MSGGRRSRYAALALCCSACSPTSSPVGPRGVDAGADIIDVAFGPKICVLTKAGTVRCGSIGPRFENVPLPAPATSLSAGLGGTCALLQTGQTYCWDCLSEPS